MKKRLVAGTVLVLAVLATRGLAQSTYDKAPETTIAGTVATCSAPRIPTGFSASISS